MRPMPCSALNRAAHSERRAVHDGVHLVPARQEGGLVRADRLGDVEVHVAVAEMAERQRAGTRAPARAAPRVASAMKSRHARQRHRDVVLDRAALEALRLATAPRGCARGRCAGRATRRASHRATTPASMASPEHGLARVLEPGCRRREDQLHQHVPRMPAASGSRQPGMCYQHDVDAKARHQLEGGDGGRRPSPWRGPAGRARRRARRTPQNAVTTALRLGEQLQHRGGDDAERAFGADEEVASGRSRCCPCAACRGRSRCGRRPAPLRGPAPARACCRRRSTAVPPALVPRLPPIVQVPSDASESGNRRSAPSAASCARSRVTPASTVMVSESGSTSRMRSMRESDSTISSPPSNGICRRQGRYCRPGARSSGPRGWQAP